MREKKEKKIEKISFEERRDAWRGLVRLLGGS